VCAWARNPKPFELAQSEIEGAFETRLVAEQGIQLGNIGQAKASASGVASRLKFQYLSAIAIAGARWEVKIPAYPQVPEATDATVATCGGTRD
jgi:hypothetical protein